VFPKCTRTAAIAQPVDVCLSAQSWQSLTTLVSRCTLATCACCVLFITSFLTRRFCLGVGSANAGNSEGPLFQQRP